MGKDSDQAFLFSEAILNDLIANEKRLHGWFGHIGHVAILEKNGGEGKTVSHHQGQYMGGMEFSRNNAQESRIGVSEGVRTIS
jgi:hypothetical protein